MRCWMRCGKVTSVTFGADSLAGLAGEHRADLDLLDGQGGYLGGDVLCNLLVGREYELSGQRVVYVVYRSTAQDTVVEGFDDLVLVLDGRVLQSSSLMITSWDTSTSLRVR